MEGGFAARWSGRGRQPARVLIPAIASQALSLGDPSSGLSIEVELAGAHRVAAELVPGRDGRPPLVVYPDALGAGAHVALVPTPMGVEDFVLLEGPGIEVPGEVRSRGFEELRYSIHLGGAVAGLRLVQRTLELLDVAGAPRLRVAPPWLAMGDGSRRAAALRVEGCSYDTSPAPPWGRPPLHPGASSCTLVVSWSPEGLTYPVLVDPLWTKTADMSEGRSAHAAILLNDGRVLAAGGSDFFGNLATSEVYDPPTDTWAAVGAMTEPRGYAAAAKLADGRVLIAGGEPDYFADPSLASAEIYDPTSGTWSATLPMSVGRRDHTATVLANGRVLVAAGRSVGVNTYIATAEEFDPAGPSWSAAGSVGVARADHTATLLADGRVLVAGGDTSGNVAVDCRIYDPTSKTWSPTGSLAEGRSAHTATLLDDGRVMVAAGFLGFNMVTGSSEIFDPAAGSWVGAGILPVKREMHTATLLDNGYVLVAGGEDDGVSLDDAALFSPADESWTVMQSLIFWRYLHTATPLGDGRVLVAGGTYFDPVIGNYPLYDTEVFTPTAAAQPCASNGECISGFCADGVCCDSACDGPCVACTTRIKGDGADGECGPIAQGTDPQDECTDDGAPSCDQDGSCDGAGACQKYSGPGCSGRPCRADEECTSGHCSEGDGLCCNSACTGPCQSCAAAKKGEGTDGVCGPIAKGTDPDHECMSASSTDCAAIALCDGVGTCVASDIVCSPYLCLDDTRCRTSCSASDDCGPDHRCDADTSECVPRQPGCEGSVAITADGEEIPCAPYLCQADGSCRTSCTSAEDCVDPFVCDTDGSCVALGSAGEPEDDGCGCRVPGGDRHTGTTGGWALLLAWLTLLRPRRRTA